MTSPTPPWRWLALPLLALLSLVFFAAMAYVYAAPTWPPLPFVFLGGTVLFLGLSIACIGIGLWQRRLRPVVGGIAILVPLVALGLPASMEIRWIGSPTTTLTVYVRDAQTGQPVAGASVRLSASENGSDATAGQTDGAGMVCLSHTFTAIGTNTLFRKRGAYYLWRETLEVKAEGYETLCVSLAEYTGPVWKLYGPPIPPVEVRLPARGVARP